MPSFYKNTKGRKKSKTSENTASDGLNLNNEADESEEENWEPLSKDILGATTKRDIVSYYPKRYWELLPKEILGAITERDTRSYDPKRY
ncbi:hypothetical protein Tco_0134222 [Tanacetum coccineum]